MALQQHFDAHTVITNREQTLLGTSQAGTLEFGAPEQLGKLPGAQVGVVSDLYSLGKTLCYCLYRRTELKRRDWNELAKHDEAFADHLERCLEEDPKNRWANAAELALALAVSSSSAAGAQPSRLQQERQHQKAPQSNP